MRVIESNGQIAVEGSYGEMQSILPSLKTWGFRWDPNHRVWWIQEKDLTSIKLKKFNALVRPSAATHQTTGWDPKDNYKEFVNIQRNYGPSGPNALQGWSLSLSIDSLILGGPLSRVEKEIKQIQGTIDYTQAAFNQSKVRADDFEKILIPSLIRYSHTAAQHLKDVLNLRRLPHTWGNLGVTVLNPQGSTAFQIRGQTYPVSGIIKSHFKTAQFDSAAKSWSSAITGEPLTSFEGFYKAMDQLDAKTVLAPAVQHNTVERLYPNKRAGYCNECHVMIPVGKGLAYQAWDDLEDEFKWAVKHADPQICRDNRARNAIIHKVEQNKNALVESIRKFCVQNGKFVDQPIVVRGEQLYLDKRSLSVGGGDWLIIEKNGAVWYIRNNGADGDSWDNNYVNGSLGYRVTAPSAEKDEELRQVLLPALRDIQNQL